MSNVEGRRSAVSAGVLLSTFDFSTFDLFIGFHHARVHAIHFKQFAVCALFDDPALFEDDDLVSLEDGVELVGDGDDRAPFH